MTSKTPGLRFRDHVAFCYRLLNRQNDARRQLLQFKPLDVVGKVS
jgi:hypothetical protein